MSGPVELVLGHLEKVKKTGAGWTARCPAHDDRNPSLSITEGDDGRVLLKCHAGCDLDAICRAMDVQPKDLFVEPVPGRSGARVYGTAKEAAEAVLRRLRGDDPAWRITETYTYCDTMGREVIQVLRFDKPGQKTYRPVHRDGGRWRDGDPKGLLPLYRLPELAEANPIYVCEGEKAVDAAEAIGLVATTSAHGSNSAKKTDWNPLAGKEVVVLPDNDAPGNKYATEVRRILGDLSPPAKVKVIDLPDLPAHGDIVEYVELHGGSAEETRSAVEVLVEGTDTVTTDQTGCLYAQTDNGLVWNKPTKDGLTAVQLTNFIAKITTEIEESDGVETTRSLEITSSLGGRQRVFEVPAASFPSMNWVMAEVGAGAIVQAGQSIKDHTRVAIQTLSGDIARKEVFLHTGWTQIDGVPHYLHAGGAIGPNGPRSDVQTRLSGSLAAYELPDPQEGEARVADVRASLRMLEIGPTKVGYALAAATYRAPMGGTTSSMQITGPTGTLKTETAAIAQAHWGAGFDGKHLPGAWSSTENALEMQAFLAKDALFTIDDFAPAGTASDIARLHQKADRIFRAQGNRSGRGRMRKDLKLNQPRPPRGMIISTGEDTPNGHSIRARMTVEELSPGDINKSVLTELQRHAREGALAHSMAAYISWAAPQYESLRIRIAARQVELRDECQAGSHLRTPANFAELMVGFELLMEFAVAVGAVTEDEARGHLETCRTSLDELAQDQAAHQAASDPTDIFLQLVSNALSSGEAHLSGLDGGAPPDDVADAVGWRRGDNEAWRPHGERIGWIDGGVLYLLPAASHRAAQSMSSSSEKLVIGTRTLGKRLAEKGLLTNQDAVRGKHTIRKVIGSARHHVLQLSAATLGIGAGENGPQTWAPNPGGQHASGPQDPPGGGQEGRLGPDGPDGPLMGDTGSAEEFFTCAG